MKIVKINSKVADGRHIENRFSYNSAADCPISVEFCVGSSFSSNFSNGTITRVPQNVFLKFQSRF